MRAGPLDKERRVACQPEIRWIRPESADGLRTGRSFCTPARPKALADLPPGIGDGRKSSCRAEVCPTGGDMVVADGTEFGFVDLREP